MSTTELIEFRVAGSGTDSMDLLHCKSFCWHRQIQAVGREPWSGVVMTQNEVFQTFEKHYY